MSDDLVKRLRQPWDADRSIMSQTGRWMVERTEAADRIEELEKACDEWAEVSQSNYQRAKAAEAKLAKAEKIVAAAKEMYETEMLTGGGSPVAWADHVRARNAFASTIASLKGQDDG